MNGEEVTYTGKELPVAAPAKPAVESAYFEVRPPKIPLTAVPIYDEEEQAVIGYRNERSTGFYEIYDMDGEIVGLEEKGLETPLFDPIDLILILPGLTRFLGKGLF